MKDGLIERTIGRLSPQWKANRDKARTWSSYYDQAGRDMARLASFRGAVPTRTDDAWGSSTSQTGVRHLKKDQLEQMRNRARQLDRDNVLASGLLDRSVENVVSNGFTLQARTPDEEFNRKVEDKWRKWEQDCDRRGMSSLTEIEQLLFRARHRDGDVGVNLLPDGRIQPIEGDLIETPTGNEARKLKIVDGVQLDRTNRPVAYWVKGGGKDGFKQIAAKNFVFLPNIKRLNQVRGQPIFNPVFSLFDQIDGYLEATVIASRMAACFGLILQEPRHMHTSLPTATGSDGILHPEANLEPGMIKRLGPMDNVHQIKPEQPQQSMPEFVATLTRFTGLNLGLPLELALLDFSRTSYSSSRSSLNQARRTFEGQQQWIIQRFLARLYQWRVTKWTKDPNDPLEEPAPDEHGRVLFRHEWIAPGWPWVDPAKETESIMAQLDRGLTTLAAEGAKRGLWWQDVLVQAAKERELIKELGLPDSRSNKTREAGMDADAEVDDRDDEDDEDGGDE